MSDGGTQLAVWIVGALGLVGGIGSAIKAVLDRKAIRAKANLDDTSATIALAAAAREMLDPLRRELAQERADHASELDAERQKVAQFRKELAECAALVTELRNELAMARVEADSLRRERESDRARIRVLESMLRKP